tara:strand:+ start:384 stop:1043 length:660 start_codon:yes stop_codon:yes gene_type:complete
MKHIYIFIIISFFSTDLFSQVYSFYSENQGERISHRILLDNNYLIETQFTEDSNKFILTRGGFYNSNDKDIFDVSFEFNSNFENDQLKSMIIVKNKSWKNISKSKIALDGKWLMGGRVTDNGERRRDLNRPRKTMKFLLNGYFQWTAFNVETFKFSGSGGGSYEIEEENYIEKIDFFSRDNSKVGMKLKFNFIEKGNDWYHKGFSSKGNPFHEIWTIRK